MLTSHYLPRWTYEWVVKFHWVAPLRSADMLILEWWPWAAQWRRSIRYLHRKLSGGFKICKTARRTFRFVILKKISFMKANIHPERRYHMGHRGIYDGRATETSKTGTASVCNLFCICPSTTGGTIYVCLDWRTKLTLCGTSFSYLRYTGFASTQNISNLSPTRLRTCWNYQRRIISRTYRWWKVSFGK